MPEPDDPTERLPVTRRKTPAGVVVAILALLFGSAIVSAIYFFERDVNGGFAYEQADDIVAHLVGEHSKVPVTSVACDPQRIELNGVPADYPYFCAVALGDGSTFYSQVRVEARARSCQNCETDRYFVVTPDDGVATYSVRYG